MSTAPRLGKALAEVSLALGIADDVFDAVREDGQDAAFLLIVAEHIAARVLRDLIEPGARAAVLESFAANIAKSSTRRSRAN